ncbi:MAG: rod-binding protein [Phycisphaeraceae bacterium]|nr:rod-binding protein [Phycisphaeraceae bacterium]
MMTAPVDSKLSVASPASGAAAVWSAASRADDTRFERELASAQGKVNGRKGQARKAAEQLVSTALVVPLLKQMRQDPFRTELFHGGQAEETFGSQLDQIFADRTVQGANFPLVSAIEKQLLTRMELTAPTMPNQVNIHG